MVLATTSRRFRSSREARSRSRRRRYPGELWTQIVSDVCNLEQVVPAETIGAAYGDALLAAEESVAHRGTSWAKPGTIVTPNAELRELYNDRYRLYLDLHSATRDIQHELAATRPAPRADRAGSTIS